MRHISVILLLLSALFFSNNSANAGILVKKHATSQQNTHHTAQTRRAERIEQLTTMLGGGQHQCDKDGEGCNCSCHKRETKNRCGSAGTTGMWLSILGWFYCPPLLIAGIAYGAHGMRPSACKKNRALAGVIIGTAGIFFWTLIIVAATLW
jgi:hypothetical protein